MADEVDTSFDSAFDGAFGSQDSAAGSDTTPSEAPESAETTPEQVGEPEAAPEQEGQAEAEEAAHPEQQPEAESEDEDVAPIDTTGKKAIQIPVGRWDKVYHGYKLAREIRDIAPDVQTAKAHYEAATDYKAMTSDFRSADPENIDAFLGHWAKQSPEGFSVMAERILPQLASVNPQAAEAIQSTVLTNRVEQLYADAAESGDPKDLYLAQMLDYKLTGKYRAATQLTKPDPLAEREASLAKREQELAKQADQRVQQSWQSVNQTIEAQKKSGVSGEVDRVLAPVKDKLSPNLFNALRTSVLSELQTKLESDFEWNRNLGIEHGEIQREYVGALKANKQSNITPRIQSLVGNYTARARNIVGAIARPLINEATQHMVAQSQAKHDRLAAAQTRRGPSGGGAPANQGGVKLPENATFDQKFDAFWPK